MIEGAELSLRFLERHPDEAAAELEAQPATVTAAYLADVPTRLAGPALARMLPAYAARCVAQMEPERAADLLRDVPPIPTSALLRHLPVKRQDDLLARLPRGTRAAVKLMLRYPATTAGAWVDPRAATVAEDDTVAGAWERLRRDAGELERWLYVVDREGGLVGRLRSAGLLRAQADTPVAQLLEPAPHTVAARADLLDVQSHPGWAAGDPLPLVGRNQRFIGVLRPGDLKRGLDADPAEAARGGLGQVLMELADAYWLTAARTLEASAALMPGTGRRRERRR